MEFEDTNALSQLALEAPVAAMSGLVAPIPTDDFVLPLPSSQSGFAQASRTSADSPRSLRSSGKKSQMSKNFHHGIWRHTIGIVLLLATVFLWTASNFLASVGSLNAQIQMRADGIINQTIFADDSYSKPYFVTYINSSFFSILLLLVAARRIWASGGSIKGAIRGQDQTGHYLPLVGEEGQALVKPRESDGIDGDNASRSPRSQLLIEEPLYSEVLEGASEGPLKVRETLRLSFEFCILWVNKNVHL